MENIEILQPIENKIYLVRGQKVMIDSDLAEIYGVETRVLNQAVKRNVGRFPESFMFQITEDEHDSLRSQSVTSKRGGRRYLPYVFTEHGAVMLATVLSSETAINASVKVVSAFVEMRKFIETNAGLFQRLDMVEKRMVLTEEKVDKVYRALEGGEIKPKQGIFYEGQIFDAYTFIADLIRTAKKEIILVDNYVDDTILTLFDKRKKDVSVVIYTKGINKKLELDLKKHNEQYPSIELKVLKQAHDRFLIIDQKDLFHIGASLKDLGKKWFAFSKFETGIKDILDKLQ